MSFREVWKEIAMKRILDAIDKIKDTVSSH